MNKNICKLSSKFYYTIYNIEYDKKCGIAIDFIPNEKYRKEIQECSSLDELSKECKEFFNNR